jgi:hypothetical protein
MASVECAVEPWIAQAFPAVFAELHKMIQPADVRMKNSPEIMVIFI